MLELSVTGFAIEHKYSLFTSDRRQSKTLLTIDERGSKSLETVFSITICRQYLDKWQLKTLLLTFYTQPHFSVGVLCYTFWCLSVCPSVRPCSPFLINNLSIYSRNFFKFCIHIVIGDEWYGIVNGQNPSIFNGVTALFRIGKMVSGLLFLYCS